ncbi:MULTISPECIES: SusC/RagA family TonB-linked outer membrane protein [Bacteroidota]|uniref:SusC/RagA family TonB-linked outer membrane protein n=1 Tax=Bacteroidota TaxID=976 RepID=UPI001CBD17C4|nr:MULTISPECIES: SusC/RagA family TonB-linked outer membrane protein [Bacteroidota]MBZ4190750.1 SusC/RagA family TonB-linked outer membrane protein [Niabella beijingensis]UMQ40858.1 SusC/RagA family TonB-linked outer membrane protein [Chryseobacterium sp. Y16C]
MNRTITIILLLFSALTTLAQNSTNVQGKVIHNDNGLPIAGATIRLSNNGQEKVVYSDDEGNFQALNVSFPLIVGISYVGLKDTTFTLNTAPRQPLTIYLHSASNTLSEVVVSTGIQKIPKERATGSFDHIDNQLFNRQISTDVLSRLDGIASSVMFDNRALGGTREISIRGLSTIFSDRQPLIILNNFPYEGDINNINPNDIEDITILKDATAASIWGVRAGNGVIVITTKKAKRNQPTTISFNSNMTLVQKPDMMQLPYMSSADYIGVEKMLFGNNFYDANEQLGYVPLSPAVELMYQHKNGLISDADLQQGLNQLEQYDIRRELNKYVYRKGINQQYSLNVSGQNDRTSYYLSGGYDDNISTTDGKYKRYSLRSDNNIKLSQKLSLDAALLFTHTLNEAGRTTNFSSIYPYARFADDNGNALPIDRYFRSQYLQETEQKGLLDWTYRPLDEINLVNNKQTTNSILINTGLNYNIGKGLNAELKYQYENAQGTGKDLHSMASYYTRNMINTYTQIGTNEELYRPVPLGDILDETASSLTSQSLRLQLNYSKTWNKHQLTGLAGAEARQATTTSTLSQQFGYNADILTVAGVNYDVEYPLYSPNGGISKIPYINSPSELNDRFVSLYTNWAYTFDNRYNLNVSARQDGSNLFGVRSNQKFTPLWSVGGSWFLTNERFLNISWLDLLKLRATYGFSGNLNRNVSALPIMRYNSSVNNPIINIPFGDLRNPPNENLRWEKNGQFNVGLDFALKGQRLSGTLEYYRKKNTDLIGYMPIDQTTGAINPVTSTFNYLGNSASMTGKGLDIQLHSINIQKALQWRTDFLYSFVKTKVTEYLSQTNDLNNYLNGGQIISPIIGKPVYSIFALQWAGLDPETGDPMGYLHGNVSKDYAAIRNETTPEELIYYGSATPTHFGSLRNTFSWKGLSLSFNISYKLGFFFKRNSVFYTALYNGTGFNSDYNLRWQKPGDEKTTQVPSMVYPLNTNRDGFFYPQSEVLISKGDNIRLQDINLSYQIKSLENKWHLKRLEVIMYATNLGVLWKADKHNVDPEFGNLSPLKTFSFGLRAGL